MGHRTGTNVLLLIGAGAIWSLVLLQAEPSGTANALGGGLLAMTVGALAMIARPSTWPSTQHAVDRYGLFVLYVPAMAAFVIGLVVAHLAAGAADLLGLAASPATVMAIAAAGGLPFLGWPIALYQLQLESASDAPPRLPQPSAADFRWTPAVEATGVFNYRGHLDVAYEATPGLGLVLGRLNLRFRPESAAGLGPGPAGDRDRATSSVIQVSGGIDADAVPFEIAVHSRHLRVAPRTVRATVPSGGLSETLRINLLDPLPSSAGRPPGPTVGAEGAGANGGRTEPETVLVEVRQADRRVQMVEFVLPDRVVDTPAEADHEPPRRKAS
jgi:hypothetical protein